MKVDWAFIAGEASISIYGLVDLKDGGIETVPWQASPNNRTLKVVARISPAEEPPNTLRYLRAICRASDGTATAKPGPMSCLIPPTGIIAVIPLALNLEQPGNYQIITQGARASATRDMYGGFDEAEYDDLHTLPLRVQ